MTSRSYWAGALAATILAGFGCGTSERPRDRLSVNDADSQAQDAALERARKLQMVRLISDDDSATPSERDASTVEHWVWRACMEEIEASDFGSDVRDVADDLTTGETRSYSILRSLVSLCVAQTLLRFSVPNRSTLKVADPGPTPDVVYKIPAQSEATNAELATFAAIAAHDAMFESKNSLLGAYGLEENVDYNGFYQNDDDYPTASLLDVSIDGRTLGGRLALTLTDAYDVYVEAMERAQKATLASAEWWRSFAYTEAEAASLEYRSPALSRYAAAQLTVGGDVKPLLPGESPPPVSKMPEIGFCTTRQLSGPALAALKVFRAAAPWPQRYRLDESVLSTDSLLNTDFSGGNIRERLEDFWDQSFSVEDPGAAGTGSRQRTVQEAFGISTEAFVEAREYMRQEFNAYARSATAKMPSDGTLTYDRYAASGNEPQQRPSVFYETVARGDWRPTFIVAGISDFDFPVLEGANAILGYDGQLGFNYAKTIDAAISTANEISRQSASFGAAGPEIANAVGYLISRGETDRQYRVLVGGYGGSTRTVTVYANAAVPWIRVVGGEDGLTCATGANVEGVKCEDLDQYTIGFEEGATPVQPDSSPPADSGGFGYGRTATLPALTHYGERNYVVVASTYTAGPGEWTAVAGFTDDFLFGVLGSGAPEREYVISVAPTARKWAELALQPDKNWCSRGRFECGYWMDDRLPLENELSDDQDDVESSWKHYIALARQAATEADQLGDKYVDASIAESERQETLELRELARREAALNELDKLQQACGTNIDPVKLLDMLGVDGDLSIPGKACATDSDCGYVGIPCVDGLCKPDLVRLAELNADDDPELHRISKCLGEDEEVDFVSLGDTPVCLWHDPTTINRVCEGSSPDNPCPVLYWDAKRNPDGNPNAPDPCDWAGKPPPTGQLPVTVNADALLGYFNAAYDGSDQGELNQLCDDVRAGLVAGSDGLLTRISDSGRFTKEKAKEAADGISFEWDPRIAYLVVDGMRRFSTEGPGWPCAAADWGVEPAEGRLFSRHWDCANDAARMEYADRMMNAALTLEWVASSNGGGGTVQVPYHVTTDFLQQHNRGILPSTEWAWFSTDTDAVVVQGFFVDVLDPADGWWSPNMEGSQYRREANPSATAWMLNGTTPVPYAFDYSEGRAWIASAPAWNADPYAESTLHLGVSPKEAFDGLGIGEVSGNWGWFAKRLAGGNPPAEGKMHMYSTPGFRPVYADFRLDKTKLMDAFELLCEVSEYMKNPVRDYECETIPEVKSISNLPQLSRFLGCVSDHVHRGAAMSVFPHFPKAALDALREQSSMGSFGENGGDHGTGLNRLRKGLIGVQSIPKMLAFHIRQVGIAMETLENETALSSVRERISEVIYQGKVVGNLADCMSVGANFWTLGTRCATAVAQVSFARELADLEATVEGLARDQALISFRDSLEKHLMAIDEQAQLLTTAKTDIDEGLAALESMRLDARGAIANAVYKLSTKPETAREVTGAIGSRARTTEVRYQRSRENAVKMALLAKRAIEQRLGVRLSTMYEDMPLVEAPASWESEICMSGGIDYSELSDTDKPVDYSAGYVGDYVTKLENLIESYRQVYAFHEGTDTAVVSLRDDVMNVRAPCEVPVENLLYHTNHLSRVAADDDPTTGWARAGCAMLSPGDAGTETAAPNCIAVMETGNSVPAPSVTQQAIKAFQITFGNSDGSTCALPDCGYQAGAALLQAVNLPAGSYRMSWFAKDDVSAGDGADLVNVATEDGTDLVTTAEINVSDDLGSGWRRYDGLLETSETQPVTVEVRGSGNGDQFLIGGLMLEPVDDQADPELNTPQMFAVTGDTLTAHAPMCEDTYGVAFRDERYWDYRKMNLCSDGYASSCTDGASEEHPFWETTFSVDQLGIESGGLFKYSGFARGNYNYRIESIGLNIVGTGARSCADEELANACYSGGFFPFSLEHNGPFAVRNHKGEDMPVFLFDGRIEHARALATERYISNPMSSADQELMDQFMRHELTGRPLDGNFILRLWDEPGVDFSAVEDIQLVLKYRYWTRFD